MKPAPHSVLISAGEASGDYYAARLTEVLRERWPACRFFGCAGAQMRAAGVEAVIRNEDLAVVGLAEVVSHLPRIYGLYRHLVREAETRKPALAILTDSPDFHFRVARQMRRRGAPVVYLVAPQVWAWRKGRVKIMRRIIDRLLCIFPFEQQFFAAAGIPTTYIGHPLIPRVKPSLPRGDFFRKHNIPLERPLVAVLPGSRRGEALRHLPELARAADLLSKDRDLTFLLPASPTCGAQFFTEELARLGKTRIRAVEGEAWDTMAYANVALAASGTVTVEGALLECPMVTFYRVTGASWLIGKFLVDVPFYSMPNLIAGREVVPELMQERMTGENLAQEAARLLDDPAACAKMKTGLAEVRRKLSGTGDAIENAAAEVQKLWEAIQ